MTAPDIDYSQRAGLNPHPAGWVEPPDDFDHEAFAAESASYASFHADISEFQTYYTNAYPYPAIAMRGDTGGRLDNRFSTNYARANADPKNRLITVYVVYVTGTSISTVLGRLKTVLGAKCPTKVAFRVDMESGSGFAGPGDHSSGGNAWVAGLTAYSGKPAYYKVDGYANGGDWSGNWHGHPSGMKRILADYGSQLPAGFYGYQYFGGMTQYPSPPGYPRSCPPFGAWVDMNVIQRPVDQIVADYGVEEDPLAGFTATQIAQIVKDNAGAAACYNEITGEHQTVSSVLTYTHGAAYIALAENEAYYGALVAGQTPQQAAQAAMKARADTLAQISANAKKATPPAAAGATDGADGEVAAP